MTTTTTTTTTCTMIEQPTGFKKAVEDGYTAYDDDLKTVEDIREFLETEFSPQCLEQDALWERLGYGLALTLSERIGFVIGYLTRAVADLPE